MHTSCSAEIACTPLPFQNLKCEKTTTRSCKVCVPAERRLNKNAGVKRKCPGHETSYECKDCNVAFCVDPCFGIYHEYKNDEERYMMYKRELVTESESI